MKLRNVLLAATLLALPAAAVQAQTSADTYAYRPQPVSGLYIGGGVGWNGMGNLNAKNLTIPTPAGGIDTPVAGAKYKQSSGFVGLGSVGYGFGNGLRAEIEGNYRNNHATVESGTSNFVGAPLVAGGGTIQQYGAFVNAFYDFYMGWPVVPYVGVGVGYLQTNLKNNSIYTTNQPNQATFTPTNSATGSFAAQGIVGAALPIAAVPGLSLTAEARYTASTTQEKFDGQTTVVGNPGVATGSSLKLAAPKNISVLIGARYNFGVVPVRPAPVPVAAPAPAPARSYLVFFDWDKADLSARAKQIIAEAAANSSKVQLTQIEVNGYADRTGTAAHNMTLSRRRADNVAAELVRNGVDQKIISIQAFGDTHLLVPTGPNTREPQNRRVEIILK
jgi:outer membrane protein OmpA-like peptidoglycan-associated protein